MSVGRQRASFVPKSMFSLLLLLVLLSSALFVSARPTIYKRNNNDKLEPVLVPVSSTVIPISVYKVAYGIGVSGGDKLSKPSGPSKLITVTKKKAPAKAEWTALTSEERQKDT